MKYGLNDIDEPVAEVINGKRIKKQFYRKWQNMLERCYSETYLHRNPTYVGCSVCDQWLKLSGFKEWFEKQPNERQAWQLDKDILVSGNKVYSPDTCLLIPSWLNSFVSQPKKKDDLLPLGVSFYSGKTTRPYLATGYNQKSISLGYHATPEEAHQAWLSFKRSLVESMKNDLDEIDLRLYNSLIKRYS